MYISKRSSQIIAVGILVSFFIGASLYISMSSSRSLTARRQNSETKPTPEKVETSTMEENGNTPKETQTPLPKDGETKNQEATFSLKDFHRSETRDGKTLWEITGSEAKLSSDKTAIVISNCELEYYSNEESPIIINSKTAEIKLLGAEVSEAKFIGDVVLEHNKNTKLFTDEATYYKANDKFIAPGKVKIRGDWYKITGKGLDGDLLKKEFVLLKDIKSTLDPSKQKR